MKVKCPGCQQDVEWHQKSAFRPFCSKRCQLIDLGQWANEEHAIASNEHQQDLLPDNLDIEEIEAMLAQVDKESGDFFKN